MSLFGINIQYLWGAADEGGDNEDNDHHSEEHAGQADQGKHPGKKAVIYAKQETSKTFQSAFPIPRQHLWQARWAEVLLLRSYIEGKEIFSVSKFMDRY